MASLTNFQCQIHTVSTLIFAIQLNILNLKGVDYSREVRGGQGNYSRKVIASIFNIYTSEGQIWGEGEEEQLLFKEIQYFTVSHCK